MQLNVCDYHWDLDADVCPCDVDFNAWVRDQSLRGAVIYHFGSGQHHTVGIEQATNGSGNVVLAITASVEEHAAYIELVAQRAEVARSYRTYFGDIYLTDARLLPDLDVVTMFHLCEFSSWNTTTPEYGGLTDRRLLDAFTSRVRAGGHLLFYPGSHGWSQTAALLPEWEHEQPVELVGQFERLLVYRKTAATQSVSLLIPAPSPTAD